MNQCLVGSATEQGPRPYQEDRSIVFWVGNHLVIIVCDGHGGDYVSNKLIQTLPPIVFHTLQRANQTNQSKVDLPDLMNQCVKEAQKAMDLKQLLECGTTCVFVIISPTHITSLNIGDSRAVLGLNKKFPLPLTWDHKPTDPYERKRIEDLGGRIDPIEGRIGRLALSRAIGDLVETPFVTNCPTTTRQARIPGSHLLLVASDGFWDVFSNVDAVQTAERLLRKQQSRPDPTAVAKTLCLLALERGSADNVTVVVALF